MKAILVNPEQLYLAPKHTKEKTGYFDRLQIDEKTEGKSFRNMLNSLFECVNNGKASDEADLTAIILIYSKRPNFSSVFQRLTSDEIVDVFWRLNSDENVEYYEFVE